MYENKKRQQHFDATLKDQNVLAENRTKNPCIEIICLTPVWLIQK